MHRLFLAEFKRAWIEFKRYPAESVSGVVTFTAVFLGLFLGAKYMAGGGATAQFGMRLDAIIVGYLLWTLARTSSTDRQY
jgi:ABC-2 type transport system permease protein